MTVMPGDVETEAETNGPRDQLLPKVQENKLKQWRQVAEVKPGCRKTEAEPGKEKPDGAEGVEEQGAVEGHKVCGGGSAMIDQGGEEE